MDAATPGLSLTPTSVTFESLIVEEIPVIILLLWILVPLALTVYYSFQSYNMLDGGSTGYIGWMNYEFFIFDEAFYDAIINTFITDISL